MPELPEVECVRRSLARRLPGLLVAHVVIRRTDVIRWRGTPTARPPAGDLPLEHRLLLGRRFGQPARVGKVLLLPTDPPTDLHPSIWGFMVHLGMSGQLFFSADPPAAVLPTSPQPPPRDHTHVLWQLAHPDASPAGWLVFRDPRRFGGILPVTGPDDAHRVWAKLGPDALTLSTDALRQGLARAKRPVKACLLDQSVAAGVGNIYADEALFAARIHPRRLGASLSPVEVNALAAAIRATLAAAVEAGGSSIRDYVDAEGLPGSYAAQHAVYGRGGLPCPRCRNVLRAVTLGQRTTVFCSACQPRRPARPRPQP